MLNEKIIMKFENCIKTNETVNAVVYATKRDSILDTDILILDIDGVKGIVTREALDVRVLKSSLVNFVGKKIRVKVVEIDRDTDTIICSRKLYKEEERDNLLEKIANDSTVEVEAKITKLLDFGAYVDMKGVNAILRNKDFSKDFTSVREVLKIGDTIKVKFLKQTESNVFVKIVEKYCQESTIDINSLETDLVLTGRIRTVTPSRTYVQIFPGFDALAPTPEDMELEFGMKVLFKINVIKEEENRVRGRIIKIFTEEED